MQTAIDEMRRMRCVTYIEWIDTRIYSRNRGFNYKPVSYEVYLAWVQ